MWKRIWHMYRTNSKNGFVHNFFIVNSLIFGRAAYNSVTFYNETPPSDNRQLEETIIPDIYKDMNIQDDVIKLESVQDACIKSDDALKELLNTLRMCILELSKEYQNCLMRQIEITYKCSQIGPLGEHWDELTEHRIRAKDYKDELIKYEALISNLGQTVYNQALNSLYSGNPQAMELFSIEYDRLEKLVKDEQIEIQYWEQKLLSVNCDSIIASAK